MRAIAGALVVVAGAFMFGTGTIAVTMACGIARQPSEYGGWTMFLGVVVMAAGAGILLRDLLADPRVPPTPPP